MITILGPTASGKTKLAVALAAAIDGEIISADSRQVYRGMDIGTGKDLADYQLPDGSVVPYHLVDICDAGEKYNLFRYQQDFQKAYEDITARGKEVVLCGGTGLYIEAVLKNYNLQRVPEDKALRASLEGKTLEELTAMLEELKKKTGSNMHNKTDVDSCKRAIRAIEIETYMLENGNANENANENPNANFNLNLNENDNPNANKSELKSKLESESKLKSKSTLESPLIFGTDISRELRRQRITQRLDARLEEGMVDEVKRILDSGVPPEDLIYYGLEYKFVTMYLIGELSFAEMRRQLEIAIHQFAKRQMTWFRGMEKRGLHINWIDYELPMEEKVRMVQNQINSEIK